MGTPRRIHGELAKLRKALADRARNGNVRFRRPPLRPSEFVPPTWLRVAILSGHGEDHSAYLPDHAALPGELASSFSGRSSAGSPGEASCFGNFAGQRGRDLAAEFIGVADWQIRVHPAFDLDTESPPGPPGADVDVDDSGHRSGGCLGAGDHRRVDAIGQAGGPSSRQRVQGPRGHRDDPGSPPLSGRPFIEARCTRASCPNRRSLSRRPLSGRPSIEAGTGSTRTSPGTACRRPERAALHRGVGRDEHGTHRWMSPPLSGRPFIEASASRLTTWTSASRRP